MSKFLYSLGKWSALNKKKVVSIWVLLLVALGALGVILKPTFTQDMTIPNTPSEKAMDVIGEEFSSGPDRAKIRVIFGDEDTLTSETGQKIVSDTLNEIKQDKNVESIAEPFERGTVSEDGLVAYADVTYKQGADDVSESSINHLKDSLKAADKDGVQTELSGDITLSSLEIGGTSEVIGVIIAFVILAVTFGSLIIAGLPILTAIIGLGVSTSVTLIGTQFFDLASTSLSMAGMIGLAVGIDYALFIFMKYREFLRSGMEKYEAIGRANGTAGSAVVFAGLTVIVALCGLMVVGIPFLSVMGITAAISVLFGVLVSITLVPAIMSIAGKKMYPKINKKKEQAATNFWGRFVTKNPIKLSVISILILVIISIPVLHLELGLPDNGMKAEDSPERQAYDLLADGFGEGFNGQLTVVADASKVDGDKSAAFESNVANLKQLNHVANVSSPMPNGNGDYAIITITPEKGPNDITTKELVKDVRDLTDNNMEMLVTGSTAVNIDISDRLNEAIPAFAILIVSFAFVLLVVVFRSLLVPLVAVLGFVLTLTATLGLCVWILQDGNMINLFQIPKEGPILAFLPILAIGILFGLAMDYQVFLVSRMREEYMQTKNPALAIQAGLKHSGPVVTSAALIMIAVFGGAIFAPDATIKGMGIAQAFGVLFDAFIVRLVIIPSVMKLMGNAAWYLPKWLDRIIPNVDIEGHQLTKDIESDKSEKNND
ncbi:membrane protein YdfJ [Terribacillus aidingensis]|uniref:Membrane protein YdfJ n=1 Tax=Terribacillus aidingensis TaxID=586416 RepID=A0A285P178_9BACI|nr:MMPL family transporter [Terribacillus aidingensis]SNZ15494.1 membrane protein YdfJ [Terribacillus aidingensis]